MLKDALILQKRELEKYLTMSYINRGKISLKGLTLVILGPRRSGKSFFCIHELKNNFAYVNFDDENLLKIPDINDLIAHLNELYKHPEILFLDEIQNLPDWEIIVNRLQRQGFQLVITGSNSNLLNSELSSHLTGRYLQKIIFPFSFMEFLSFFKKAETGSEIKQRFEQYLIQGGFPEILVKDIDGREYIKTLTQAILYKDVVRRYKLKYPVALHNVFNLLINNISKPLSYNSLVKSLQLKSVHTVEKYIEYLENAFLLFIVHQYSRKIKEQIKSNKKIYAYDNAYVTSNRLITVKDYGRLLENIVAIRLQQLKLENRLNFYYYKTKNGYEVDFIIIKGNRIKQLIQIAYEMNIDSSEREIRALIDAGNELHCNDNLILTFDQEEEKEYEWFGKKRHIRIIPAWKWLQKENL